GQVDVGSVPSGRAIVKSFRQPGAGDQTGLDVDSIGGSGQRQSQNRFVGVAGRSIGQQGDVGARHIGLLHLSAGQWTFRVAEVLEIRAAAECRIDDGNVGGIYRGQRGAANHEPA